MNFCNKNDGKGLLLWGNGTAFYHVPSMAGEPWTCPCKQTTGPCTSGELLSCMASKNQLNEFSFWTLFFFEQLWYTHPTFSENNEQTNAILFEDFVRKRTLETVNVPRLRLYTWSQSLVILRFASISASSGTLIPNGKMFPICVRKRSFRIFFFRTTFFRKTKLHRYSDIIQHI